MIQQIFNPAKEKKKTKQYDCIITDALHYYKNGSRVRFKDNVGTNNGTHGVVGQIWKLKEGKENFKINNVNDGDIKKKSNGVIGVEFERVNSLDSNLCFSNESHRDELLRTLKHYINEYMYDVQEEKYKEIINCADKKKLLKKYIYEIKKYNFVVLEDLFFFFSISNDYNDYALSKMFHCLLLVFDKKEEKYVLLVLYIFLMLLNENSINKYFTYIIDCLINILNVHECTLPIDEINDNIRLFDHKPMILNTYLVNENARYFLFSYFCFLTCTISKQKFMSHADKIIRVCLVGIFDQCCEINCLMMNFIQEIIEQVEDHYINYHYIISTCLLKCLCNKYSKVKIKCMDTLTKLILNNNNSKSYKIIEMLVGYKDPNVIPIKCFYDHTYVNINYLCNLYNDKSVKVKFNFYSFLFILLYEFNESNDFITFLMPYLFSACCDNYKIFRLLSFLYIQLICRKKKFDMDKNMNDEIIYQFNSEWSYKTSFTLPLPLTEYYFHPFCRNSILVKKNMYKLDIAMSPFCSDKSGINHASQEEKRNQHPSSASATSDGDEKEKTFRSSNMNKKKMNNSSNPTENTFTYEPGEKKNFNSLEKYEFDEMKEDEYSVEYYQNLLLNFLKSNKRISNIIRDNKIKQVNITYNEMNKQCKQLSFTILNAYFKCLYKVKEDETNQLESLENIKIILLLFYFIEDNITEHIPYFISHLLHAFEKKLDEERWCIYMNCLYLIGSYVKPSNYYFFLENYLKNVKENNQKQVTLTCLYMLNGIGTGTIETYKNIKKRHHIQNGIHDCFVEVLKKMINLLFYVLNEDEHLEKYFLILQIIHTIVGNECTFTRLDANHIIQLVILLHISFNKIRNVRNNFSKGKDKICLNKNFYLPIDVLDIHFYVSRIKKIKNFEHLDMNKEQININIGSEILYKIFKLSDDNLNQQIIILQILSDELLYNSNYVYFLIQYIIKRQTFFYDKSFSIFLCKIIIKILNLNQNKKNIIKRVFYNEDLELYDIYQENKEKNKNQIKHVFLEHVCTIFLLFIFKNLNIYETFNNVIETCKIILYLLIEVKNPYSFLFFVKQASLVNKLCDILECREAKSIYFCKHITNDMHINYEKYINNDGDIKYLDHINIGKKISIRNKVNNEVDILFYFVSICIYLIYYKSLYCLSTLLKEQCEDREDIKLNELFTNFFDGTQKRVLNALKVNEKSSYTSSNLYKKTIEEMLRDKKDFSELFLIRNKILNSPDYNDLILNIHIYFRHSFALLQGVHMFLLHPVILHYFYEVNQENIPNYNCHNSVDLPKEDFSTRKNNFVEEKNSNYCVTHEQGQYGFIKQMEIFFQQEDVNNIIGITYDHTNLSNYFKTHDLVFFILEHDIYHIPFRIFEKNSQIILLYSSLLFFADEFFQTFVPGNNDSSFLSNISVGLSNKFFVNPLQINEEHLTSFFNLLVLLYLENEDIFRDALVKTRQNESVQQNVNFDKSLFSNIVNNILFSYDKKDTTKDSLCCCLNFLLNVLSVNYGDILISLKGAYTRTKHVKRLEVCNAIISTFL
ncbi:hypothetical protein, conserved [Plasmodium gonderi]|uniref:Uncharacterized protein n=1 Tax=Plasmodium gonderi TaxID=77519 RepID=A0A1Y1JFS2_PLAGO|nr:hypothetical protein, conserved [Plasmodium gonderi]GAW81346.1 hypothetical protein, conserved [Plasmodium gonderi]